MLLMTDIFAFCQTAPLVKQFLSNRLTSVYNVPLCGQNVKYLHNDNKAAAAAAAVTTVVK